jgi:hypothetical protein|tara:strand:+ start:230 stop:592 length:363 start_codon:yes stop_codon:yes gene_type:complete
MVTTKKDAEEFASQIAEMQDSGKSHAKDPGRRGPNDLEEINKKLKIRIAQLEGISKVHRALNGELRQEVYDLKMKVNDQIALENKIEGQKKIIRELSMDNQRLAKEVDDKVSHLRKLGLI